MTEKKNTQAVAKGAARPATKSRGTARPRVRQAPLPADSNPSFGVRLRGSLTEQIEALDVGESIARCKRFATDYVPSTKGTTFDFNKWFESSNSTFCTAIQRVKRSADNKGKNFRVERGRFLTSDNATMLVLSITRTE